MPHCGTPAITLEHVNKDFSNTLKCGGLLAAIVVVLHFNTSKTVEKDLKVG